MEEKLSNMPLSVYHTASGNGMTCFLSGGFGIHWIGRTTVPLKEEFALQPNPNTCGAGQGKLPGSCASLAYPFVAKQNNNPDRYNQDQALAAGTLFPGLDLPFRDAVSSHLKVNNALAELMALDFAIDELGLYLTTHPQDQEVLDLYWSYIKLAKEGRAKYQEMYGPLLQTDLTPDQGYAWLKDPWPWEEGGND